MSKNAKLNHMYGKLVDEYREIFLDYLKQVRTSVRIADIEADSIQTVEYLKEIYKIAGESENKSD